MPGVRLVADSPGLPRKHPIEEPYLFLAATLACGPQDLRLYLELALQNLLEPLQGLGGPRAHEVVAVDECEDGLLLVKEKARTGFALPKAVVHEDLRVAVGPRGCGRPGAIQGLLELGALGRVVSELGLLRQLDEHIALDVREEVRPGDVVRHNPVTLDACADGCQIPDGLEGRRPREELPLAIILAYLLGDPPTPIVRFVIVSLIYIHPPASYRRGTGELPAQGLGLHIVDAHLLHVRHFVRAGGLDERGFQLLASDVVPGGPHVVELIGVVLRVYGHDLVVLDADVTKVHSAEKVFVRNLLGLDPLSYCSTKSGRVDLC